MVFERVFILTTPEGISRAHINKEAKSVNMNIPYLLGNITFYIIFFGLIGYGIYTIYKKIKNKKTS